eukprot:tig00000269_g23697.t1
MRESGGALWLLAIALCCGLARAASSGLPPGSEPNIVNLPVGQYAHCVGSLTTTGNPDTSLVTLSLEQGTFALLEYSASLAYDEYNSVLWYGTWKYLYKIRPSLCDMEMQLGQFTSGNVDGDSTTASFHWLNAIAPLPSKKVVLGDYNCRLRLYDPASNTVSHLFGSLEGAGTCVGTAASQSPNTVGQPPGAPIMGLTRGLAYSPVDGRVYVSWTVGGEMRSEIWSMRPDGASWARARPRLRSASEPPRSLPRPRSLGPSPRLHPASDHEPPAQIGITAPHAVQQLFGGPLPSGSADGGYTLTFAQDAASLSSVIASRARIGLRLLYPSPSLLVFNLSNVIVPPPPPRLPSSPPHPRSSPPLPVLAAGGGARLIVPAGGLSLPAYMHVMDRAGAAIGSGELSPRAPPELCPSVISSDNWTVEGCWCAPAAPSPPT